MSKSGSKGPRFGSSFSKKPRPGSQPSKTDGGGYVRDSSARLNQVRKEKVASVQRDKKLGEAVIERFGHDGRGVTQLDGKTVFVSGALVGERVTLRLVDEQPRFIEARVDALLETSPARQTPPCPHFGRCGGCQLQHIAPPTQVDIKQQAVVDQVRRWGGTDALNVSAPITAGDAHYRARARLGVWYDEKTVQLGFREKSGKTIVGINNCYVLAEGLSQLIAPLAATLTQFTRSKAVTHVEMIDTPDARTLVLRHIKPLHPKEVAALEAFVAEQHALGRYQPLQLWLDAGAAQLTAINGESVDTALRMPLADYAVELDFYPRDFTQVNPAINQRMIARALELAALRPEDTVVDLFCGMGNFTLPIAKRVTKVIGVEGVDTMVARATANAARNQIANAEFIAANLADDDSPNLRNLCATADVIFLDPPRDGAREVVSQLLTLVKRKNLKARALVYVSCNPATLARDTAILVEAGFTLANLGVLDMFPHTAHVESIALFTR